VTFPISLLCPKELTIKGSFRYGPGDYEMALELVSTKKINVKKLISSTVQFKNAEEAFQATKEGKGIKILIEGPLD
jgi:D-xylulose reductase